MTSTPTSDIPNNFVAKTYIGSFNVKIANREYITIGTQHACVQIGYNQMSNVATLDWLGTEKGGCEMTGKEIHGKNTIAMTDLGFTILKQLYPDVNPHIMLRDSSKFPCNLPDGNRVSISNMIYNLLITGKTYYQNKFGATLKYPKSETAYKAFVEARQNPHLFNKSYNFNNSDLNKALAPLLQTSANWGDFFEKIYTSYGRHTCTLLHSWYMDVFGFLAQEAIHADWVIDISTRPYIEYAITTRNNSKNYTRKSYVYNPYDFHGGYFPSQISYHNILRNKSEHRSTTLRKTRKSTQNH
jgi:hypothetical protein